MKPLITYTISLWEDGKYSLQYAAQLPKLGGRGANYTGGNRLPLDDITDHLEEELGELREQGEIPQKEAACGHKVAIDDYSVHCMCGNCPECCDCWVECKHCGMGGNAHDMCSICDGCLSICCDCDDKEQEQEQ